MIRPRTSVASLLEVAKSTRVGLLSVILLVLGAAGAAAQDLDLDPVVEHLEFNGYTATVEENTVSVTHDRKLNFIVKSYRGGLLLQGYIGTADRERQKVVDVANSLNVEATACRFYVDSDGDLIYEAWSAGPYDRTRFSLMLEEWESDTLENMSRNNVAELLSE